MTLDYRAATPDDVESIAALWQACGIGSGAEIDQAEIRERLTSDDGFFVVGERDGRMVASAMGCYDNHRGWVKRVAVDPSRQRQNLGSQLVAELERRFLAAGISKLRLAVWGDNAAALSFWREHEYDELSEIHYFSKDLRGGAGRSGG